MVKRGKYKPETVTRKQLSRRAREEKQQKALYISAAIFAVIILLVLAIGLYQEFVSKPARPIAEVAGVPIRTDKYEKMLAYYRMNLQSTMSQLQVQLQRLGSSASGQDAIAQYYQQQLQYLQSQLDGAPQRILEDMIDDELIRQEAERVGLSVSDEELQLEIETQFGYDRNPPPPTPTPVTATLPITVTPTPTIAPMTEADFQQRYAETLKTLRENVKFSEQDLRGLFLASLLRQKLEEYLGEQLPESELQVRARHILLTTREEAEAALARLKAGEDFGKVAKELSTDKSTSESGGDLGWFPIGMMDPEFEKVAFNTPPGQISEIVQSSYGFHIIKVEEKDENRALDPAILEQRKQDALESWLAGKRHSDIVKRMLEFATPTAE